MGTVQDVVSNRGCLMLRRQCSAWVSNRETLNARETLG